MNYSAHEYWTGGQRVRSLAPTDGGLRQCDCGAYFLMRNTIEIFGISQEEHQATEAAFQVDDEKLPSLLAHPQNEDIEFVVRRRYWRYLNDPYRELYRAHRQTVNDAVDEANKGATTFWRTLGGILPGNKPPRLAAVVPKEQSESLRSAYAEAEQQAQFRKIGL